MKKKRYMSHKTWMRICAITAVLFILAGVLSMVLTGCGQINARNAGGTCELHLPDNYKLVDIKWEGDSLWYLIRPMRPEEEAEEYEFSESDAVGLIEGTVIVREVKTNE